MSKLLTLYQKVLIVKWFYQNNGELFQVRAIFEASFRFSPIPTVFDQVLKAFEMTGSVTEDVICGVKEESAVAPAPANAVTDLVINLENPNVQAHTQADVNNEPTEYYEINEDFSIKVEPLEEEEEAAPIIIEPLKTSKRIPTTIPANAGGKVECKICYKMTGSKLALARHQLSHRNGKGYVCPICGRTFENLGGIIRHSGAAHNPKRNLMGRRAKRDMNDPNRREEESCKVCGKWIQWARNMKVGADSFFFKDSCIVPHFP